MRQFLASLRPVISAEEQKSIADWLPPAAARLFRRMSPRDQRHSLNVAQTLAASGHDQPDLLAAALLHDVAKSVQPGRRLRLRHRIVIVLLNAANPRWVSRLAGEDPASWRYPYYVHLNHPAMGAVLVHEVGCSPLAVELVRRHQTKQFAPPAGEFEELLLQLQAADDAN
ncbi:MAG: HD domain-containing protein [Caldilineales bacterium]